MAERRSACAYRVSGSPISQVSLLYVIVIRYSVCSVSEHLLCSSIESVINRVVRWTSTASTGAGTRSHLPRVAGHLQVARGGGGDAAVLCAHERAAAKVFTMHLPTWSPKHMASGRQRFNLGLVMCRHSGFGIPRGMQGLATAAEVLADASAHSLRSSWPNQAHSQPPRPRPRLPYVPQAAPCTRTSRSPASFRLYNRALGGSLQPRTSNAATGSKQAGDPT